MSTMYRVKNRGASTVVYKIADKGIRREFKPGQVMQISSEELEELTFQPGGTLILSQFLQILDLDGLNAVHIKTEPEYHMSEQDVLPRNVLKDQEGDIICLCALRVADWHLRGLM